MTTKDMLQYCDEALAWEEFGPVDIFFFESVKKILLGECPAMDEPEEMDELANMDAPISAEALLFYEENKERIISSLENDGFFSSGTDYVMADGKAGN